MSEENPYLGNVAEFPAPAPPQPDPAAQGAFAATEVGLPPEKAAEVLRRTPAGGDPMWTAENLPAVQQEGDRVNIAAHLDRAPAVAEYMQQSPAHAALVKPDVPVLTMLSEGLQLGFLDIGYALEGSRSSKQQLTPDEEEKLAFGEQVTAAGVPGATTLPRKVGAEIARATPMLALFGTAALTGAAIGSVGGPVGAGIGALVASAGVAYTIGFGPLYRRLRGLTAEDGETPLLTDDQAKAWATAGAGVGAAVQVTVGAPFLKALPGVSGALQRVGLDAAARAAQTSVGRAAVQRLGEYGGHVLSGALAMAGQSATNATAVELAKQQNGAEPDWGAVTDAAVEGFKTGLLLAPLALFEPGRGLLEDRGRIRDAHLEAARLEALAKVSKDLGILTHAPDHAEQVIGAMANGQTVHITPEHLPEEVQRRVAEVAGPEAMAEAQATHGDVAVPVEKYLVRLGDQHEALRQDVKLSPDGMTVRQVGEVQNQALSRALAEREIAKTMPDGPERRAALDAAHEKMRDAIVAQYGGTPEEWAAKLSEPVAPGKTVQDVLLPEAPPPVEALKPSDLDVMRAIAAKKVETMRLGDLAPGRRRLVADNLARKAAGVATQAAEQGTQAAREGFLAAGMQSLDSAAPGVGKAGLQEAGKKATRAEAALTRVPEFERAREANLAMARAEEVALKGADVDRKFLLRYTQDEARGELGKAGGEYLDQVDRLLSGFELGQGASRTEVARRLATMDWIAKEQAEGRDPVIPDSVMAKLDRFVHWKELTPQELRDLRGAVDSIERQAELKNTLLERQQRISREDAKAQLIATLRANTEAKPFKPAGSTVGNLEKVLDRLRGLKYGARAIERIVNTLDGGDVNGPWHRFVWDPISDSTNNWHDLVRRTTDTIVKTIDEMPAEDARRWRETRFKVNGIDYDLTAAVAVALNWGNDSNRGKLVRGWQDKSVGLRGLQLWNEDTPEQFLSKLTRKDWQFVQTVWNRLESMWPEAVALEKRLTGLEPPKVEARAFKRTLEDGTTIDLHGGYYPVIYDPDFSRTGKAQQESADLRSVKLFDQSYYRAATPQGYLQKRVENFARPVLLSIDSLPHKISETAKDVSMREALLSVHSVLTDDEISAALHTSELGRAGEKVLLGWLRDTANDLVVPDNGAGPWFTLANKTRAGYTASLFAYNLAQTAQNLTAIAPATAAVGPKWMSDAMLRLAKERGPLVEWMKQQSGELRNADKGGQAVVDALRTLQEGKGLTRDFMQFGLKFFQSTDIAVKYPTWLAAYSKGVAAAEAGGLGFDHTTAVRHADAAVRLNVMAANTKDLPAVLRSRVGRWMLPLYSYSLHRLNLLADAVGMAQSSLRQGAVGKAAIILGGTWGALAAEAVTSELVKGNGPQDEDGDGQVTAVDAAIWTAKMSALAPLTWLPVLGSVAKTAISGHDAMPTPEQSVMSTIGKTAKGAADIAVQIAQGEDVDEELVTREALHLLEVGGYLSGAAGAGLPVSQIRSTLGYVLDENSPKEDPLQVGLGVAFGKSRPGKLLHLTE